METAVHFKKKFLVENPTLAEIKTDSNACTVGNFEDIDVLDEEVWLLQCPKGANIAQLQDNKMKLPGRSNIDNLEAVAVEFESSEQEAFAYSNHKGNYSLRLLPVVGSIVLRRRLKANELVSTERIEQLCPPEKRVPVPNCVKVRHPIFGNSFEQQLKVSKAIAQRLRRADDISSQVMRETRLLARKRTVSKNNDAEEPTIIKKKSKRTYAESVSSSVEIVSDKIKKSKKSMPVSEEDVSEDLQWLKKL